MFNSQEALWNISPLIATEKFSGARNGKIQADFYDECHDIPDPSALDPVQKNLLLLDDCFLCKQNKAEAYYTRTEVGTTIAIRYTLLKTISDSFEKIQTLLSCSLKTRRISHISMLTIVLMIYPKQFCHGVWSKEHNFVTIDLTSTPTNGKYRLNFNRFYFSTDAI